MKKNPPPKNTIILGAGPAGLACAYELSRSGISSIVLEKDNSVGGLSKTLAFGIFKTDIGPHRFFTKNRSIHDFIRKLLGKKLIKVERKTTLYAAGKVYRYPISLPEIIFKTGILFKLKSLKDYFISRLSQKKPLNFEEYIVNKFGRSLGDFCILNYTEKIWGMPCSKLSVDWAHQRIPELSMNAMIKGLFNKNSGVKSLTGYFYYPEAGTGLIYETIKKKISKKSQICLGAATIKIEHEKNLIKRIILEGRAYEPSHIISSIPITRMISLLEPKPPEEISEAAASLRFRSQVYLFITLDKSNVTNNQWIYFPETEIPFSRISEMKNFSVGMSPKGKTSLLIEFFCTEDDLVWNKSKEELYSETIAILEKLRLAKQKEVLGAFHFKIPNAYPIYDMSYRKILDITTKYLDGFRNLEYIGRLGRFKYTNQDHSIEMGIAAAKNIITGKRYNFNDIGADKESYEK